VDDPGAFIADLNRQMLAAVALPPPALGPEPLRCPVCGTTRLACVQFWGRDEQHERDILAALDSLSREAGGQLDKAPCGSRNRPNA
jgi:hypothetical protein